MAALSFAGASCRAPSARVADGEVMQRADTWGRRDGVWQRSGGDAVRVVPRSSFRGIAVRRLACIAVSDKRTSASSARAALVQKVTARELDEILAGDRPSPMVVDFYATWCGPCILLAQELEKLAIEYGSRVRFLKIDTDEEHELATQMEIRGLPTMVFVSQDVEKLAIRTEGLLPSHVIRDIIEKSYSLPSHLLTSMLKL